MSTNNIKTIAANVIKKAALIVKVAKEKGISQAQAKILIAQEEQENATP